MSENLSAPTAIIKQGFVKANSPVLASKRILSVLSLVLLWFGAGLGISVASAANISFSYNQDLSDGRPLSGALVRAQTVYLFLNDGDVSETKVECCDWTEGPGSNQYPKLSSNRLLRNQARELDLSAVTPGSVRSLKTLSDGETLSFTVVRSNDFSLLELRQSGAVTVSDNGQVIENLDINANERDECGIYILGKKNITIRNVRIRHKNRGICVQDSTGLVIESVHLTSSSAGKSGPHCKFGTSDCASNKRNRANPDHRLSIMINNVPNARMENLYMEKGSGGLWVYKSDNFRLNDFVCKDIRGPYARGQCLQLTYSDNSVIKNFYAKNYKGISYSGDNINFWESDNANISHGLIDGNWSVNGVGVIADRGADNIHISNMDIIDTGPAAVSVWSNDLSRIGRNLLAENIRVKDTHCDARDGRKPSSGGLVVAAQREAINPVYRNVQYWNHCREQITWCMPGKSCRRNNTGSADIREEDFEVKNPLVLLFPWENPKPVITRLVTTN